MSDTAAPWMVPAREFLGLKEFAGSADNPQVIALAQFVGSRFPETADYAASYKHDATAWCGVLAAAMLARVGIAPPFGATATQRFMWAQSFQPPNWGVRLDAPRKGCLVVFRWANGSGHVGFLDRVEGRTLYILGGNQSDAVTIAAFAWNSNVVAFVWPSALAAEAAPSRTPADVRVRMGQAITLAEARRDAQGRLAVYALPAGDGGGAYEVAGINERWHPVAAAKLKGLIESGRHAEAETFVGEYLGAYTDVADVWTANWGVEFYLRDSVFHRGPTGAVLILQIALKALGADLGQSGRLRDGVDGAFGPLTEAALRRQEPSVEGLLVALRNAREFYERNGHRYINGGPNRDESSQFWRGLINRFNNQLTVARRFHAEQPKDSTTMNNPDQPTGTGGPTPQQPVTPNMMSIDPQHMTEVMNVALMVIMVMQMMRGGQVPLGGGLMPLLPQPQPQVQQQPQVQPEPVLVTPPVAPVAPAPAPAQQPGNLISTLLGIFGLGAAGFGQITGVMPVVGPEASMVGPSVAFGSLIPLLLGGLGAASPTLGLLARVFAGGIAGARQR